jgi:dolichyl-phosphate beta-glucosyltransferase
VTAPPSEDGPATTPRWSVVIPAFNEARRLPRYLTQVVAYFEGRSEPWEVLVVDDGSRDGTAEAVAAAARGHEGVRVLRRDDNLGKGAAVRRGMLAARGAFRLFADADGATAIVELKRLEAALGAGADVAIGSRALADPSVSVVARAHRVVAGRTFSWVVGRLGLRGIRDSQCGFKAFTARAAEALFEPLKTHGFGFDVELLLRARAGGYRVAEVAVNWVDQPGSKVGVVTHGPRMVWDVLVARRRIGRRS